MEKKHLNLFKIVCVIMGLALVSGCVTTSGNFARLKHDDQVKQTFESFTVEMKYLYYYFGTPSFPKAVVGISKEFSMDSTLWKPIDLTSEHLHDWIWGHANINKGNLQRYGSNIIGPDGAHIGVWYSLEDWTQWARIELVDKTKVKIGAPINDHHYSRFGMTEDFL